MLKKLFSSIPINNKSRLNCADCRLYNPTTKLCKINKLNALENRLDDKNCGLDGKNFWSLDKTNLIKSEQYYKYNRYMQYITIISLPCVIIIDFKIIFFSIISFIIEDTIGNISLKYKQKYLNDNNINDINDINNINDIK